MFRTNPLLAQAHCKGTDTKYLIPFNIGYILCTLQFEGEHAGKLGT